MHSEKSAVINLTVAFDLVVKSLCFVLLMYHCTIVVC